MADGLVIPGSRTLNAGQTGLVASRGVPYEDEVTPGKSAGALLDSASRVIGINEPTAPGRGCGHHQGSGRPWRNGARRRRFLRVALRTDGHLTFPADSRVGSGESVCIGDTGDAVSSDRSILYGVLECP